MPLTLLVSPAMASDDSTGPQSEASDAAPADDAPDASHLTPEEKRGPRTIHVALGLLTLLIAVSVITTPESILPRDSTLAGTYVADEGSQLEIVVPVGWKTDDDVDFGSLELVPADSGSNPDTRIFAGALEPGIAAAAIADNEGAATAMAETVQQYILGVSGTRDDKRTFQVQNELGSGSAVSYVVVPDNQTQADQGGLVYAAVFGTPEQRWWVAYVTTSQQSSPGPRWMSRIVDNIHVQE